MRDLYLIMNSLVALSLLGLGIVTFINNRRSLVNSFFFLFTVCVGIWLVSACVSNDIRNTPAVSLYGNYAVFLFSYFSSYLLVWFAASVAGSDGAKKWLKHTAPLIVLLGVASATPLVVGGVEVQGEVYAVNFGPLTPLYALSLVGQLAAAVIILHKGLKTRDAKKHAQIKTLYLSLLVSIPILLATQFIAPAITGSFQITDIGILIMVLPAIGLYVSVIRHGLFDIKLAAVRSTAYAMALVVLAAIYYCMAYLVSVAFFKTDTTTSVSISPVNIFLALILAFMFQPIKQFFDRLTDNIFYRDAYKSDDFFARLSEALGSTTDLRGLLRRAATEIAMTLKAEQAFFFVQYGSHHVSAGTKQHALLTIDDAQVLERYVNGRGNDIIISVSLETDDPVRRLLERHHVALLMPLVNKGLTLGYLALGEQQAGGYASRDTKVLKTISDELMIAIQNALSVQDVKDINAHLQQRIDAATRELKASNMRLKHLDATKDEFLSMASHQLRTPLTSVKGYLSMVLEGDAGDITPAQRQLLDEAFESSEKMVHLIGDFLNVSRLQTGKFTLEKRPTNLVRLVEDEVRSLQGNAAMRDIHLDLRVHGVIPSLMLDDNKLRQVVMNYMDNALYYSGRSGKQVDVVLAREDDKVVLRVEDDGIGIPAAEQEKIFTKFFRASNARKQRPDGTGVGLYLAKKVVVEHGGAVIFSSIEGKGSTFGFSLPIAELTPPKDET